MSIFGSQLSSLVGVEAMIGSSQFVIACQVRVEHLIFKKIAIVAKSVLELYLFEVVAVETLRYYDSRIFCIKF